MTVEQLRGTEQDSSRTPPGRPRDASRAGRDQIKATPRGCGGSSMQHEEQQQENEPGSRARSRSKAVTRRRAQWRADHGLPPREEEWAAGG